MNQQVIWKSDVWQRETITILNIKLPHFVPGDRGYLQEPVSWVTQSQKPGH